MEQLVNIGAIVVDAALQPRQQMDMAMVLEYSGEMQGGAQFPAVVAFGTVEQCWLADGFHRVEAARIAQLPVVKVELRAGGRREAQLFSLGANATHGLRRTNSDKRRAVETALRDEEWTLWSDREIAQRCAVSAPLVAGADGVGVGPRGAEGGAWGCGVHDADGVDREGGGAGFAEWEDGGRCGGGG